MSRRLLLLLAALALVGGAIVLFAWPSLEDSLRRRIEIAGSALTGAPLHVDALELALPAGAGKLLGLRLGNPPGFGAGPAFATRTIDFRVEVSTIEATTVVVDRVEISAPQVTVVVDESGTTNFRAIGEHLVAAEAAEDGLALPRLAIARLEIGPGTVRIRAPAILREDLEVPLEGIALTDLGTAEQGWTVHRVARAVRDAEVEQVANALGNTALARLGTGLGDAARQLRSILLAPSLRRPIEQWTDALRGGADAVEQTLQRAQEGLE